MTEAEWLACVHSEPMLDFLQEKLRTESKQPTGKRRKLLLFALACCRRCRSSFIPEVARTPEWLEAFVAGQLSLEELAQIEQELYAFRDRVDNELNSRLPWRESSTLWGCNFALWGAVNDAVSGVWETARHLAQGFDPPSLELSAPPGPNTQAEFAAQAALLREILGNPFRPATIDPVLLDWRDRTIPKLARAAYDERDLPSGLLQPNRLAILADALEEAGCTSDDILGHLRGPGPHVRGCSVVDLLIGKE
ncbi:MAG: hypothetical protein AB7K24_27395 [Gemmataceae bacterium]